MLTLQHDSSHSAHLSHTRSTHLIVLESAPLSLVAFLRFGFFVDSDFVLISITSKYSSALEYAISQSLSSAIQSILKPSPTSSWIRPIVNAFTGPEPAVITHKPPRITNVFIVSLTRSPSWNHTGEIWKFWHFHPNVDVHAYVSMMFGFYSDVIVRIASSSFQNLSGGLPIDLLYL